MTAEAHFRTLPFTFRVRATRLCCIASSLVEPGSWHFLVFKDSHPGGVAATTNYEAAEAASRLLDDAPLLPSGPRPPATRIKDGHSMICSGCLAGGSEKCCTHPWDMMASAYHTGACSRCGHEVAGTAEDHLHCPG